MKVNGIKKLTDCKYLNLYKLDLTTRNNNQKEYFVASRRDIDNLACKTKKHDKADAVMIVPITKEGEFVLVKQFRPAINDYIYEFPAGLVDEGEDLETASKRELFEETGLRALSYEVLVKPSYTSVGMSDEAIAVVKVFVEGEITNANIEETEELEVLKIKISDSKDFIKDNNVSIKAALVMALI